MKIYFIRHGIAEVFADSDFQRELTLEGKIKLNDTFREFVKIFNEEDYVVYSSPLTRAVQTAEILCDKLNTDFEIKDYLAGFSLEELKKELEKDGCSAYILVTHEPYISQAIYDKTKKFENISRGSIHILEI